MRRWWPWCKGKVAVTIICWAMSIFISQICPPKCDGKSSFYCNNWNAAAGQRRLWGHWKLLGMKVLIKHFKENGLVLEIKLRTQRSRLFPKSEKTLVFGILAKLGSPSKFVCKLQFFKIGWKWHILCKMSRWWRWRNGKVALTIICLVMSIFISEICPLKWVWKSASYRNNWNASAGQRRLWRHWKLLGMKVLIKHFKKSGLSPETMLRTQRSRPFPKPEKWLIFGILTKGWAHDNFLESFIFRNG